MGKPKLVLVKGEGKIETSAMEALEKALKGHPRYKDTNFQVVEDDYFKHIYRVIPPYDCWIVTKPEKIWIFWHQIAFNVLKTTPPEQILPYTKFKEFPSRHQEWIRRAREIQKEEFAATELSRDIMDFDAWANSLLSDPPISSYVTHLTDPRFKDWSQKFIEAHGFWMFLKVANYVREEDQP